MTTESILTWVKSHSEEETLRLIASGEELYFQAEKASATDPMVLAAIQTAYVFCGAERDRRREVSLEAYYQKVDAGDFQIGLYFGYKPYTFEPSETAGAVRRMYTEAAEGVEMKEIASWLNAQGFLTIHGKRQTKQSVKAILASPVYCGDVKFRRAGVTVTDHHTPLVSRTLWNRVQEVLRSTSSRSTFSTPSQSAASTLPVEKSGMSGASKIAATV